MIVVEEGVASRMVCPQRVVDDPAPRKVGGSVYIRGEYFANISAGSGRSLGL